MKYCFDGIIVVEGKNDVSFLSSFIDSVFVITNGYEIPSKEIEFINNERNAKKVIILTDSDAAGKQIREKLNKVIRSGINVEVDLLKCNKNHKHGVAECDKDEVIDVLKEHFVDKKQNSTLSLKDLNVTKEERDFLCEQLRLGTCNSKIFIKRINYLEISLEEINNLLTKYGNK